MRRNVRYGRAENLVFESDALELLPGSGAFNPRIRAKPSETLQHEERKT